MGRIETRSPTLTAACDDANMLAVELTPKQRSLLEQVEQEALLHVWALGRRSGKTLLATLIAELGDAPRFWEHG